MPGSPCRGVPAVKKNTYTAMPNRPTRASDPAAIPTPEFSAAVPVLISKTAHRHRSAAARFVASTRHWPTQTAPAHTPSAAKIRLGCGPESPIAIGNGGNSNAALRKSATHLPGAARVQRAAGIAIAGASRIAFIARVGARATAAAQHPRVSASHRCGRDRGMTMLLIGGVHVSRITRASPGDALLLIIHFHRQVHRRQHQTEQQCRQ